MRRIRTSTPLAKYCRSSDRDDRNDFRSRSKSISRYKRKRSRSRSTSREWYERKKSKYDEIKASRSIIPQTTTLAAELKKKRQELMKQGDKSVNASNRSSPKVNNQPEETIVIDDDSFRTTEDESVEERQVPVKTSSPISDLQNDLSSLSRSSPPQVNY